MRSHMTTMKDAATLPQHILEIGYLTGDAFAPYGQVIVSPRTGREGARTSYDAAPSVQGGPVLENGESRLWVMLLPGDSFGVTRIARHPGHAVLGLTRRQVSSDIRSYPAFAG
jgi:hypothetical protein